MSWPPYQLSAAWGVWRMRSRRRLLLVELVLAAAAAAGGAGSATPAEASTAVASPAVAPTIDPCGLAPTITQPVCHVVGGVISGGTHALTGAAGAVVGGVANGVLGSVASAMGEGAAWFVSKIADLVTASTSIDVTAAWFGSHYRVMALIAAAFAVAFLLLTAAGSLLHQDSARTLRAVAMTAAAG